MIFRSNCDSCPLQKLVAGEITGPTQDDLIAVDSIRDGLAQNEVQCDGYNRVVHGLGRFLLALRAGPDVTPTPDVVCESPFIQTEEFQQAIETLAENAN